MKCFDELGDMEKSIYFDMALIIMDDSLFKVSLDSREGMKIVRANMDDEYVYDIACLLYEFAEGIHYGKSR